MTDLEKYRNDVDSWAPMLGPVGDLAQKVAATQFVPKAMRGNPAAVAAVILTGREMGMGPMTSLRGIDVIEGRPALTAAMVAARILAAGHRIEWGACTDTAATVRIVRGDGLSAADATWTKADAVAAGLWGKAAWRTFPRYMLRHRALTEAAGMACPDVILGLEAADTPAEAQERPVEAVSTIRVATVPPAEAAGHGRPADGSGTPTPVIVPDPSTPEVVEAELVEEDPLVTPAQLRKIGALIGRIEQYDGQRMDRTERRHYIAALIDRPDLESAKDLTKHQASDVIERLQRILEDRPVLQEDGQ